MGVDDCVPTDTAVTLVRLASAGVYDSNTKTNKRQNADRRLVFLVLIIY
jgi:hypothetical protein